MKYKEEKTGLSVVAFNILKIMCNIVPEISTKRWNWKTK